MSHPAVLAPDPGHPYSRCVARQTAQNRRATGKGVRLAMLDVDSTLTGNPDAAGRVRSILEARGYVVAFNTSRTEEMVMTAASYLASREHAGFRRPAPHLGKEDGRRVEVPQESAEPRALLDPEIIAASTGTRILLRQSDGRYLTDRSYGGTEPLSPAKWRKHMLCLIDEINLVRQRIRLATIEDAKNYELGISDVYPPDYRIQLEFDRPEDRWEVLQQLRRIRTESKDSLVRDARRIHILDDSEPREDRFKAFLMPRWASKARAAHHIIRELARQVGVAPAAVEVLFIGDSYPDLHMGLVGGAGNRATLLLVGRSRLLDVLWLPETVEFAGHSLRAVKQRMNRSGAPGHMRYRPPCGGNSDLQMIVGDVAFPGSAAVDTIEQYLRSVDG